MRRAFVPFLACFLAIAGCRPSQPPEKHEHGAVAARFRAAKLPHLGAQRAARGPTSAGATWTIGALEMRALDVENHPIDSSEGLLTTADVAIDTDAVWSAEGGIDEEWRILLSSRAPTTFRWQLHASGTTILREGRVEVTDAEGRIVVRSAPFVAYDAEGTARTLEARLDAEGANHVLTLSLDARGLRYPIAVDPGWVSGPTMGKIRKLHKAVSLADGRVFFMGGEDGGTYQRHRDADIYDPATNTFSLTGDSGGPTGLGVQVIRLGDGRVLAAGGAGISLPTAAAAVWSPTTKAWAAIPSMPYNRKDAATVLVSPTRVLLAGGGTVAVGGESAVVYNATTNAWTEIASMSVSRGLPVGAKLPGGTILVCGGATTQSSCEHWNPTTNAWAARASMSVGRASAVATTLADGRIFVSGGVGLSSAEIYNPTTNTWSAAGNMAAVRAQHVALLLPSGKVFVAGGTTALAQLYDPATNAWAPAGSMSVVRDESAGGLLASGKVIVSGGTATSSASSEIWGGSLGVTCTVAGECLSGSCVDGVCCGSASCGAGAKCNLPGKLGTCSKPAGTACGAASECASGFCTDAVCCNAACTGQCASCNVTGKVGTCSPVLGPPVGGRAACATTGAGTACAASCNGINASACTFPPSTTACGTNTCAAGKETRVGTCNGAGVCSGTTKDCGVYACGPTSCLTTCTSATDCAAGNYCKAGVCVPVEDLGTPCKTPAGCTTGFCTDGVCCGVASCAAGSACSLSGFAGTCKVKQGSTCKDGTDCGTGICVDGVCCNEACSGQCEACDVEGRVGVCSAVDGRPHGTRTACADGGGDVCAAATCAGNKDRTTCVGKKAPIGATCRETSCVGSTLQLAATCDGSGTCPAAKESSCVPYACEGTSCRQTCSENAHCTTGFVCKGSRCEPVAARCTDDLTGSIGADGVSVSCAPYVCTRDGTCAKACASSTDCAPGNVCDVAQSVCVPGGGEVADSGGCSVGNKPGSSKAWLGLLGLLGASWALRRRRFGATLALGVAGCSSSGREAPPTVDAGVSAFTQVERSIRAVRLAIPGIAASAATRDLDATLPTSADAALHLALPGANDFFLDVFDLDARPSPTVVVDGMHVATGDRTDSVFLRAGAVVEDLRVVHEVPEKGVRLRLAIENGAAVARVRTREGRIEALDPNGRVWLASAPIVAIDANGERRELSVQDHREGTRTIVEATLDSRGLALPIVVDPIWTKAANLSIARYMHSAVRLGDGRVLAVGGDGAPGQPELYDPKTNTWSKTGKTAYEYGGFIWSPGLLVLSTGKVLAVSKSAELFDPATGTWTDAKKTSTTEFSAAVPLPGGKVLVTAVSSYGTAATVSDIYTVATGAWTSTGAMKAARNLPGVALLPSGKVLLVGGGSASQSSAEIYDPATNAWTSTSAPSRAHWWPKVVTLPSGKVFVTSGRGDDANNEIYDPTANTWAAAPAFAHARDGGGAVLLSTGKVLFTGGLNGTSFTADAQLFDPVAGTFSAASSMSDARSYMAMAMLADGRALAIGGGNGFSSGPTASNLVDIYGGALGTTCAAAGDCGSGACVNGVCCASPSCTAPATCNQPGALGTCTKPIGSTCAATTDCASGRCVDGYCCDAACGGQCEACDIPGKLGVCSPTQGAPRGKRSACTGPGAGTACGDRCDGIDRAACHVPGASASCGVDACVGGVESRAGTCATDGTCSSTSKSCEGYICGATTCKTSCGGDSDCKAGYYCKSGACAKVDGLGTPCTNASTCTTGLCTDGVCCGVAVCGVGESCGNPENPGVCSKKRGTVCLLDPECASGHCVDGVCCESACDGQCEACDIAGKFGSCTPIDGEPHGARSKCSAGSSSCEARTCAGTKDSKTCVGYAAATETTCAPSKCEGTVYVGKGTCNGAGACAVPDTQTCTPYVCDSAGCRTGCTKDEHCAEGFVCDHEVCIARVARCSADRLSSQKTDGTSESCSPYLCTTSGACGDRCTSSTACAPGALCDPASNACVFPSSDSEGGCGFANGGATPGWALVVLLALVGRRRRSSTSLP